MGGKRLLLPSYLCQRETKRCRELADKLLNVFKRHTVWNIVTDYSFIEDSVENLSRRSHCRQYNLCRFDISLCNDVDRSLTSFRSEKSSQSTYGHNFTKDRQVEMNPIFFDDKI